MSNAYADWRHDEREEERMKAIDDRGNESHSNTHCGWCDRRSMVSPCKECVDALAHNDNHCPHCGVSLQGAPIPPESQHLYGATHFGREVGQYDMDKDMTVAYRCPDCGKSWERK